MIPTFDFINPTDDKYLKYSKFDNRYILNETYAPDACGEDTINDDLGGTENLIWILDHLSQIVYQVIDNKTDSKYRDKVRFYLSHSKRMRNAIRRALVDILIYSMQDGGVYTAYASAKNFAEMKAFDIKLTDYCGVMVDTIILNGGLAERVVRWNLNTVTTEFINLHDMLVYMNTKGYIDINDYYDRYVIASDGSNFTDEMYSEIVSKKSKFVAIESPIIFDSEKSLDFIFDTWGSNYIEFSYETGYNIILGADGSISGSPIDTTRQETFYIDFKIDDMPSIPNSKHYDYIKNGTNGYTLFEYGYWEQELAKKGVEW